MQIGKAFHRDFSFAASQSYGRSSSSVPLYIFKAEQAFCGLTCSEEQLCTRRGERHDAQSIFHHSVVCISICFHEQVMAGFSFSLLSKDVVMTLYERLRSRETRRICPDIAVHEEESLPHSSPLPRQSLRGFTNCTAAKSYGYLLSLGILTM